MSKIGFCAKCRKRMPIENPQELLLENNMKAIRGTCGKCDFPIFTVTNENKKPSKAKPKKCKERALCVKAGKISGNLARKVYPIRKFGTSAYEAVQKAVKKSEKAVKETFYFCTAPCRKIELRRHEKNQHQLFAQLGSEIYKNRKKQTKDIINQSKIKSIIGKINDLKKDFDNNTAEPETPVKTQSRFEEAVLKLKNKNPRVRLASIGVLESLGQKDGISYLTDVLSDTDEAVRTRASEVINKLTSVETPTFAEPKEKPKVRPKRKTNPVVKEKTEKEPKIQSEPEKNTDFGPYKFSLDTAPTAKKPRKRRTRPKRKQAESKPETENKTEADSEPTPEPF